MAHGDDPLPCRNEGVRQTLADEVVADRDHDAIVPQQRDLLERAQHGQAHDGVSGEIGSIVDEPDRSHSRVLATREHDVGGNPSLAAGADDEHAEACVIDCM